MTTFAVTVAAGKFVIDGVSQKALTVAEGTTYTFDQADATNANHPLRLSTTSDGTHNSGSEYTTGVTTNGTPGQAGSYTRIVLAAGAPPLYYYCSNHSGMGGTITTSSTPSNARNIGDSASVINFLDGVTSNVQTQLNAKGTGTVSNLADLSITSTAAELNKLDAVSRGSLIYGNPSAETAILTKGTANQVLTSDGTDISWADAAAGGTNGWQLISTTTISGTPQTVDITSGINSTYDNYVLVINNLTMASVDSTYVMWYKASSLISGSDYNYTEVSSSVTNRTSRSAITIAAPTPAGSSVNGNFFVFNANSTVAQGAGYLAQTQRSNEMGFASGSSNNSGAVTGLRIRTEAGSSFATGTFRLYGIAQS